MPLLFAATLFISASLLFMVQPMVGKLVLPLLGGSPAVWNACMVFFQALLLLGYLYADRLTRLHDTRKQWIIHIGVMTLPVAAFVLSILIGPRNTPIAAAESLAPTGTSSAILSVLAILTLAIGVPFFVVSTSATLLQKWFTYTGHPSARDPYFLYSASNAGSLISLLGYPIFIEPNMTQGNQTWFWAVGFLGLFALISFCGRAASNPLGVPPGSASTDKPAASTAGKPSEADGASAMQTPPSWLRMAKWTALAFVPSSLMLGVTFHMTTDIASIPLLWVGPLALYLITFIIAFGRVPSWFRILIGNLAPVMILLLVFLMISPVSGRLGVGLSLLLHLVTFFTAALMCHYELARDRPAPQYLTTYFLIMSLGGVLGGIFNSLIAPLAFPLAYEYPLALIIACLMVPNLNSPMDTEKASQPDTAGGRRSNAFLRFYRVMNTNRRVALALDLIIPVLIGLAFWRLQRMPSDFPWYQRMLNSVASGMPFNITWDTVYMIVTFALPVMICFFFVDRPVRFALSVAAILGPATLREANEDVIHTERSFFGILKIERYVVPFNPEFKTPSGDPAPGGSIEYLRLVHGTTLHGTQAKVLKNHPRDLLQMLTINPWDNIAVTGAITHFDIRQEPLTYYHRTGPVGAMFRELTRRGKDRAPVAMVGLGTGSVACYAKKGQKLTFYEIDPTVKKLVADTDKYFTFVTDARNRGAELDFRLGDARLVLKHDTDRKYQLLLVDAFSSDSIPVHLLTKEAVGLYLDRLTDDGVLALHISNKYVELEPVVAAIAKEHNLVARVWNDNAESRPGKTASSWVALARTREALGDRICSPIGDYMDEFYPSAALIEVIHQKYPGSKAPVGTENGKQKDALLEFLDKRSNDPQAQMFARWIRRHGSEYVPLMNILQDETGYGFRPLNQLEGVSAWTDDYADVMAVMTIPELQAVRKFFGLPTPVEK